MTKLIITSDTTLKTKPLQSSDLTLLDTDKLFASKDTTLDINWYKVVSGHYNFELKTPLNGKYNWFVFCGHAEIEDNATVTNSLSTNPEGLKLIKDFEGLKLDAYLCPAGVPTIGYGITVYSNGIKVKLGDRISEHQAEYQLQHHLRKFESAILDLATVPLTSNQFSALVSFVYNVGIGAFTNSTLLKVLNKKDYVGAADELLRWNKAGGKVLAGLKRRREAERQLYLKGITEVSAKEEPKNSTQLANSFAARCEALGEPLAKDKYNIVGISGLMPIGDKAANGYKLGNTPDLWNDSIGIIAWDGTYWKFVCLYRGTTEPGVYYTQNPLNKNGAAVLAYGKHPSIWAFGTHKTYEALVQVSKIELLRDRNKNYQRDDATSYETGNGVNLHSTSPSFTGESIGHYSAGCTVIQDWDDFLAFKKHIKGSRQYRSNPGTTFDYWLLPAKDII